MSDIAGETILKALAGISTVLLAWFFGDVVWDRMERVPQLESQVSVLYETARHQEHDIQQNRKDIKSLYMVSKNSKSTLNNNYSLSPRPNDSNRDVRFIRSGGRAFAVFDLGSDLLLHTDIKECAPLPTSGGSVNTSVMYELYPTSGMGERLGCVDPDGHSNYILTNNRDNL